MYQNAEPSAESFTPSPAVPAPVPQPFTFPPLFIRKADTVVSWSPKSGCSHVVLWAFVHEGFLQQAGGDRELPHRFRIHVYQKRAAFKTQMARLRREGGAGQTLLKVTRDPKRRLVSIFRHACRFPFLRPLVQERLGFDPAVEGLSLTDLDAVLGGLPLIPPTTADPHVRGQYSPLWDLGFDRVITLNMDEIPLNASLAAVERSLGLPPTNFARIDAFRKLREIHYARPRGFALDGPVETHRFKPHETKAFPKHQLLASPLLESMARRHYHLDYGGVGSGDTAGELFQPEQRAAAAPPPTLAKYNFTHTPTFLGAAKIVVSWSTKAGCSHVILWAFVHNRLLDQALAYDAWPHKFRMHVYEKHAVFKLPLQAFLRSGGAGHTLLKVTRDPKARLVSIFRHACRFPFLRPLVQERLGFDPAVEGLSLTDLDAVLGGLPLIPPTTADPHVRGQYSPLWDLGFDRVITLNLDEVDLDASLNAVERALGLPVTDFASLPAFQRLHETHHARTRDFALQGPIETHRFRPRETQAFPKQQLMASPLLESMARRHYGADYGRVGSSDTAGELFPLDGLALPESALYERSSRPPEHARADLSCPRPRTRAPRPSRRGRPPPAPAAALPIRSRSPLPSRRFSSARPIRSSPGRRSPAARMSCSGPSSTRASCSRRAATGSCRTASGSTSTRSGPRSRRRWRGCAARAAPARPCSRSPGTRSGGWSRSSGTPAGFPSCARWCRSGSASTRRSRGFP